MLTKTKRVSHLGQDTVDSPAVIATLTEEKGTFKG